jgi:16S rRNA (guanine527-N7)-methyltransferase
LLIILNGRSTMDSGKNLIQSMLEQLPVKDTTNLVDKMDLLVCRLLEENLKTNLTAVRTYEGIVIRHLVDSWMPLRLGWNVPGRQAADIGTGAGFPGLILALFYPDVHWTLVESVGKKVNWLDTIKIDSELQNVTLVQQRAEETGKREDFRESFNLIVSRAVAPPPVMLEFCLPLVKPGGQLWAWQGEDFNSQHWQPVLKELGGEVMEVQEYLLPGEGAGPRRHLVKMGKTDPTPDRYPRRVGIPAKRPLG